MRKLLEHKQQKMRIEQQKQQQSVSF